MGFPGLSFMRLWLPECEDMVSKITFPALLGEMALMLWLIVGAKVKALHPPAP